MASPALVDAARASLAAHPPFSALADEDLDFVACRLELAYFAPGERVLGPDDGVPAALWIVRQGAVQGIRAGQGDADGSSTLLVPGEAFPVGALMAERPTQHEYRAVGDAFCWRLPKAGFDALVRRSGTFLDFCKRRTAALLDLSQRQLQASYAQQATQRRSMKSPLGEHLSRVPVTVPADASLREAFETMERERVGSVIVGDGEGILTRQDVVGRVVLPGVPLEAPVRSVMSAPLLSLDHRATVAEAVLLMAERRIRHVPVTRDGAIAGIVTERDLFALQRQTLRGLADAIAVARAVPALARVAEDLRAWSATLVAQGVSAAFATRLISRLNDQLSQRLIAIESAADGLELAQVCWLALGSEGREEQTIATDQDNGLVLPDGAGDALRERWLACAQRVNRALDACGYPLCRGGIMAGNPRWCLEASQWRALFDGWIERGDPDSLLAANVFFDLRALAGDGALAAGLRARITERAAASPRFLKQMADNARRHGPPPSWSGGLLGQWFATGVPEVDLKLHGTAPFVDGARLLALAHRVPATGTVERLEAAAHAGALRVEEVRAWADAFHFLQSLRLRVQHERREPRENPNLLDARTLSDLDRRILKESFRQARALQQRLAVDFPG